MDAIRMAILNLQETRRRSIKLWRSLPVDWFHWRPDKTAMSFGEMIRHVWEGSYEYHMIIRNNGTVLYDELPFQNKPILTVEQEIALSEDYFNDFIDYVNSLTEEELSSRIIDRSNIGYQRILGDMLLRTAYHDAVHTGQFLQYMRMAGIERPLIWD